MKSIVDRLQIAIQCLNYFYSRGIFQDFGVFVLKGPTREFNYLLTDPINI